MDRTRAPELVGRELHTTDGEAVGIIREVYLDDDEGQPEWVTVDTGRSGTDESFVPLMQARWGDAGPAVPYTRRQIQEAPRIGESGHLTDAEENLLYEYYGLSYADEDQPVAAGTPGAGWAAPAEPARGRVLPIRGVPQRLT